MSVDPKWQKPGIRLLGIAESSTIEKGHAILGGIVIRADLIIDGVIWEPITLGGMDGTDAILRMLDRIAREDISGIIVHGAVIARYNMIDLPSLYKKTGLPVISITKEAHQDLAPLLASKFPEDWQKRLEIVRRNGEMKSLDLATGTKVYIQAFGADWKNVEEVINRFSRVGGMPEPIRIARLFARAIHQG